VVLSEAYICGDVPIVLDHSQGFYGKYTIYDTVKHAVNDNYSECEIQERCIAFEETVC